MRHPAGKGSTHALPLQLLLPPRAGPRHEPCWGHAWAHPLHPHWRMQAAIQHAIPLSSLSCSYFKGLCEQPAYVVFNGAEGAMTEMAPLVADQVGWPCATLGFSAP